MRESSMMAKFVSILLTIAFLSSQAIASPMTSVSSDDTLAPSVASDPDINPSRSDRIQGDVANDALPGAIGNGRPLRDLLRGQLPPKATYPQVGTVTKFYEAISLAITLASQKIGTLPEGYNERADEAADILRRLINDRGFSDSSLHIFNAIVKGEENYLLGFSRQGKIGLSVELIQALPTRLLAQYIFHEAVSEKGLAVTRDDHRNIYQIMQTAIFGAKDVEELRAALRSFINEGANQDWPNPASLPPEKRVLMLISGGESAGVNNYFADLARRLAAKGYSLELVKFGLDGLVKAAAEFDGTRTWVDWKKADKIKDMPGATEGTARVKLDDKAHPEYMANALANLRGYCKTLVMIGGNDHLGEAGKIAGKLKDEGIEMVVVALPKTIDRDTKVYPIGASSAGRDANDFVLRAAPLPGSNKCVIAEIMGRDMGWLAVRAGDMRPRPDTTEFEERKMAAIAPTVVIAVPEWSVDEHGEQVVLLSDIAAAVKARMEKYGAATVLVSEGFRLSKTDPLLEKILDRNPLLKVRFSQVKTDVQGNLILNELGISDFIAEMLEMELPGIIGKQNLSRELFGYAVRARVPDELDKAIADDATAKAAALITDEAQRQAVITQGGVCICADLRLDKVREAMTKVQPLTAVQGKVDLKNSGLYTIEELTAMNVLGPALPTDNLVDIPKAEGLTQPAGKNIALAITAVNSMSESARDMNRVNLCVFPGPDGDALVDAVNPVNRKPISKADAYVIERTNMATMYIDIPAPLTAIIRTAYHAYEKEKFVNIIISGNFWVWAQDPLLETLSKDAAAKAIIDAASMNERGRLVFGRRIVDLLAAALGNAEVVKAAGVEPKKLMSGIRKNAMDESLNLLPGEEDTASAPKAEEGASLDQAIAQVGEMSGLMDRHIALNSQGKFEMNNLVVIMKKDLPESVTGKRKGISDRTVKEQYRVMKQNLRKLFPKGVVEAEDNEELVSQMNAFIDQGVKVIVLDDGTLSKAFDASRVRGKAVENYCVIAVDRIEKLGELSMPFVNLNAMAYMGVGVIYGDTNLFEMAYKAFTGNDVPPNLIEDLAKNTLWLVRMLPRIVRFTDDLTDQQKLKRLVDAAA